MRQIMPTAVASGCRFSTCRSPLLLMDNILRTAMRFYATLVVALALLAVVDAANVIEERGESQCVYLNCCKGVNNDIALLFSIIKRVFKRKSK